ncbi:hypothetical protein ACOI22_04120 [Glaciecola sp. 2405UD65-10]|jgi:hypothetical protein|uniref:hypothetical protein n=1 Tax=Glaciecola sp. 2405UD65-10 TaxID=3397244 RepID=UPI003B59713D
MKIRKRYLSLISLAIACNAAANNEWQPASAESLMQLPANLIEKRIVQDFRMSPLASELLLIDEEISATGQQIAALKSLVANSDAHDLIDEKVDLVQLKSQFLDLMQQGQELRQNQLQDKMHVYQEVLAKLYSNSNAQSNDQAYQLKLSQQEARARMEKVMQRVDQALLQDDDFEQSPYATEFAENLSKIDQLKEAISKHQANMAATVDGIEVSTQEYIRQLLMQAASEQSLLDQEGLMLSYMSKIVALDAQSLEFAISESQEQEALSQVPSTTPASSVSLFL